LRMRIQKGENQPQKIKSEDQKKIWKLVFSMQSYFRLRTWSVNV
jgi:hypothetical protein